MTNTCVLTKTFNFYQPSIRGYMYFKFLSCSTNVDKWMKSTIIKDDICFQKYCFIIYSVQVW